MLLSGPAPSEYAANTQGFHVGTLMFVYILGPVLFGWYGLFLGPIILILVVHFTRLILPELVEGEPIQPIAVDPPHLPESIGRTAPDGSSTGPAETGSADAESATGESANEPASGRGEGPGSASPPED